MLYVAGQSGILAFFWGFDIESGEQLWQDFENDMNGQPVKHIQILIAGNGNLIITISYQTIVSLASCGGHGDCNTNSRICECNAAWHGDSCGLCNNNCSLHGACNMEGDCKCYGNWAGLRKF
jgi:hypothetical protein